MLLLSAKSKTWNLVYSLGAFGFFPLGIIDSSLIPAPGSMDALLVFLVIQNGELWWYYAIMATAGSLIGAMVNYRLVRKGGEGQLIKRVGSRRANWIRLKFARHGFLSVMFIALAPPPVPTSPLMALAAFMHYPRRWFATAYATGRIIRFGLVAAVTHFFGGHIFRFFSTYYKPALWTLGTVSVIGTIVCLVYYRRWNKEMREREGRADTEAESDVA
jgi:membrane protein YqaA with SNARE-associated domain